ncbi:hypothetical protein NYZ99_13920 [Maribacter litopenaei]|uniref:Uncharacterized protein n=1 Tax=Maribacter litopenaei TaxID=2976127 RepID=A0ABY5Y799_9FLAO|nr:hypothetical protein [Maribacter litopenaei]UWX54119.1 hypothetical protein NYZ99_13920 [Maribacter litopenaei]
MTLTLLGQYIIKNLIILGALGVLWLEVAQENAPATKIKEVFTEPDLNPRRIFRFR